MPILRDIEDRLDKVGAVCVEYHSEPDRREIDHLLSARFVLFGGEIHRCHLGALTYVAREVIARQTSLDAGHRLAQDLSHGADGLVNDGGGTRGMNGFQCYRLPGLHRWTRRASSARFLRLGLARR